MKKLLIHADISESANANCIKLDNREILRIPLQTWKHFNSNLAHSIISNQTNNVSVRDIPIDSADFYGHKTNKLYIDHVVTYIAGFITRSILKRIKCYECPLLLTNVSSRLTLIHMKNRGGLVKPSDDVIKICQILERHFRISYKSRKDIFKQVCQDVSCKIPHDVLPIQHTENPRQHRSHLIKYIIIKYLQIRFKHYEQQKRHKIKQIRKTYTKLILFKNQ